MLLQTYVILITLWENINKIVGFVHFGIYILISHGEPLQILDVRPNTYFGVSFFFRSFWRKKRKHKIKKNRHHMMACLSPLTSARSICYHISDVTPAKRLFNVTTIYRRRNIYVF